MTHFISMNALRVGDKIVSDGGFTCLPSGTTCEIHAEGAGLYIICAEGHHDLEGQRDDKTGECIGFYPHWTTKPAANERRAVKPIPKRESRSDIPSTPTTNIQSITIMADTTQEVHGLIFGRYTGKSVDLRLTDPAGRVTKLDGIQKSAAWSVCNWFESMWKGREITIALCDSKDITSQMSQLADDAYCILSDTFIDPDDNNWTPNHAVKSAMADMLKIRQIADSKD